MRVNVNCALYGRCYAVGRRFMLVAFLCCFFYGSTVGRDSIPIISADASGDGAVDSPVKPLSVGDEVPDVVLNMINYPKPVAKLSDFRGKVVILDFWATWCGGCIQAMPKEDTLQEMFDGSIQFLLVNSVDKIPVVNAFLENKKGRSLYNITLPIVAGDSILKSYFPFTWLPHYVVIDANGKVVAITSNNQINIDNIKYVIDGKPSEIHQKNDQEINDFTKPYLLDGNNSRGILMVDSSDISMMPKTRYGKSKYVVFSKETYIGVAAQGIHFLVNSELLDGVRYLDFPLKDLLQIAYPEMQQTPANRWIMDNSVGNLVKKEGEAEKFSFEMITPAGVPAAIVNSWMQISIFEALGVSGQYLTKDTDCFVIEKSPGYNGHNFSSQQLQGHKVLIRDYLQTFQEEFPDLVVVPNSNDLMSYIIAPNMEVSTVKDIGDVLEKNGYSLERRRIGVPFFRITKSEKKSF